MGQMLILTPNLPNGAGRDRAARQFIDMSRSKVYYISIRIDKSIL